MSKKGKLNLDVFDEAELERKQQLLQDTAKKLAGIIKQEWKYGKEKQPEVLKQINSTLEEAFKMGIAYDDEIERLSNIFLYFLDWKNKIIYWMTVGAPNGNVDGMHWFQIGEDGKFKQRSK